MCLRGSTHDSKVPGPTTRSRGPAVSGLGAVNMLHLKVLCAQNDGCFDENKCQLLTTRGFFLMLWHQIISRIFTPGDFE